MRFIATPLRLPSARAHCATLAADNHPFTISVTGSARKVGVYLCGLVMLAGKLRAAPLSSREWQ